MWNQCLNSTLRNGYDSTLFGVYLVSFRFGKNGLKMKVTLYWLMSGRYDFDCDSDNVNLIHDLINSKAFLSGMNHRQELILQVSDRYVSGYDYNGGSRLLLSFHSRDWTNVFHVHQLISVSVCLEAHDCADYVPSTVTFFVLKSFLESVLPCLFQWNVLAIYCNKMFRWWQLNVKYFSPYENVYRPPF